MIGAIKKQAFQVWKSITEAYKRKQGVGFSSSIKSYSNKNTLSSKGIANVMKAQHKQFLSRKEVNKRAKQARKINYQNN